MVTFINLHKFSETIFVLDETCLTCIQKSIVLDFPRPNDGSKVLLEISSDKQMQD